MRKACAGPLILLGNLVPLMGFALFLPTLIFEEEHGPHTAANWAQADSEVDLKDSVEVPSLSSPPPKRISWAESLAEVQQIQRGTLVHEVSLEEVECEVVGGPPVHVTLFFAFMAGGLLDSQTFRRTMPMF